MIAWPAAPTNGAASVSALPAGLNMPARGSAGGIAASSRPGGDGTNPGSARDVQMKTVSSKRARGSSPSGRTPPATTRMPATLIAEVEAWATANGVTRSDAIRRLVELGLTASVGQHR
jgi:hypothetical protein